MIRIGVCGDCGADNDFDGIRGSIGFDVIHGRYADAISVSGIVGSFGGSRGGCRLRADGTGDGLGSGGGSRLRTDAGGRLESDLDRLLGSCDGEGLGSGSRGRLRSGGDGYAIQSDGGGQLEPGGISGSGSSRSRLRTDAGGRLESDLDRLLGSCDGEGLGSGSRGRLRSGGDGYAIQSDGGGHLGPGGINGSGSRVGFNGDGRLGYGGGGTGSSGTENGGRRQIECSSEAGRRIRNIGGKAREKSIPAYGRWKEQNGKDMHGIRSEAWNEGKGVKAASSVCISFDKDNPLDHQVYQAGLKLRQPWN